MRKEGCGFSYLWGGALEESAPGSPPHHQPALPPPVFPGDTLGHKSDLNTRGQNPVSGAEVQMESPLAAVSHRGGSTGAGSFAYQSFEKARAPGGSR